MKSTERQLRIRKIANNFITMPCLTISVIMLLLTPALMWGLLAGFNFLVMMMNFSIISQLQNTINGVEISSEKARQQRVKDLYGGSDE